MVSELDGFDPFALGGEGNFATDEAQGVGTEHFGAPAMEDGVIGGFVQSEGFDVFAAGDQAGGDVVLFGAGVEQDFEQGDEGGGGALGFALAFDARQFFFRQRLGFRDGGEERDAGFAGREARRDAAGAGQRIGVIGREGGDFGDLFVFDEALAGDIDALGLAFPPGGDGLDDGELAAIAAAQF